jgi:hypothetical protein
MPKNSKTVGYLVTRSWWMPFEDTEGVLRYASRTGAATLFSSRSGALLAIRRTLDYSQKHNHGWVRDEYQVTRVSAEPQVIYLT